MMFFSIIQLLRGIDPITFRCLQRPGVTALICFSCRNANYRQIKPTQHEKLCFSRKVLSLKSTLGFGVSSAKMKGSKIIIKIL